MFPMMLGIDLPSLMTPDSGSDPDKPLLHDGIFELALNPNADFRCRRLFDEHGKFYRFIDEGRPFPMVFPSVLIRSLRTNEQWWIPTTWFHIVHETVLIGG